MAQITIDDPLLYESKNVDSNGKVHLGKEFAGKRVTLVIEEIVDEEAE